MKTVDLTSINVTLSGPIVFATLLIACLLSLPLVGCGDRGTPNVNNESNSVVRAQRGFQSLIELEYRDRPNAVAGLDLSRLLAEPLDSDSIQLVDYRGNLYYHPVHLVHSCFAFMSAYYQTRDTAHLDRTEKYVRKLMSLSHTFDGAAYLPYEFQFAVHGDTAYVLPASWYSGMAQGEFLAVLMRLYEFTNNEEYLEFGHKVFASFLRFARDNEHWTVRLDDEGYYWIEEYPTEKGPGGRTLNGFIVSVFGLYDYFLVTESELARLVFDISLTTLKQYIPEFRRRNEYSFYCLEHQHRADRGYHNFHVKLLRQLFSLTDDSYFESMADLYEADGLAQDSI